MTEEWRKQAACRGLDGNLWFPEEGASPHDVKQAKEVCASCPVQLECLLHALANCETAGIWGGMTYRQRCKWRQKRREMGAA